MNIKTQPIRILKRLTLSVYIFGILLMNSCDGHIGSVQQGTSEKEEKKEEKGLISLNHQKVNRDHPAFNKNVEPFYSIIMEGLKGEVDGEHFWDAVAENAIFEFLYNFPGFTNKIEGRDAYMDWFGGYTNILHSANNLRVYKSMQPNNIIILEYEVHGIVPTTGKNYDNRFCSIITVKDRKIVHWRDYMDSLAVMLSVTPNSIQT